MLPVFVLVEFLDVLRLYQTTSDYNHDGQTSKGRVKDDIVHKPSAWSIVVMNKFYETVPSQGMYCITILLLINPQY